jgi:chromosomal replication initiator protein
VGRPRQRRSAVADSGKHKKRKYKNVANLETKAGEGRFEQIWNRVRDRLRADIGLQRFTYWIEPLRVVSASETRVVIACTSRFERDKVVESHGDKIAQLIADMAPNLGAVEFIVETRPKVVSMTAPQSHPVAEIVPTAEPQLVQGSIPLNRSCTFASFVTGRSNQIAFNEAKRAAEADIPQGNPLFFFGGTGLGKSHLMHAIAWKILEKDPTKRVLFITAETFMRRFVTAVKGNQTLEFKDVLRNVDLLLVDDVHFILSKEGTATQEEFFHTFDALVDANKQIVLSADRSPSLFDKISDRVRSRLMKGASVEIGGTDLDLRLAILESKVEKLGRERPGISIGSEALHFMAQRIATNTRELEGALNRVVTQSESGSRPVTIENLQVWLADFLKAYDRRVTIEEIKRRVADHFQLKVADLESPNRSRSIVRPRQIAMYLSRILTPRSFPEIGKRFGDRDHTTVMHAVTTVKEFIEKDPQFAEEVEALRLSIRNWPVDQGLGEAKIGLAPTPVQPQI